MPKIRVRPAASRNNKIPNWNPLRVCSKSRIQFTWTYLLQSVSLDGKTKKWRSKLLHSQESNKLPGHFAIFSVRILVIGIDSFHDTGSEIPIRILNNFTQIEVLDGEMVVAVFERTSYWGEICFTHGITHSVFIWQITTYSRYCTVNQHDRVVRLCCVKCRIASGFFCDNQQQSVY